MKKPEIDKYLATVKEHKEVEVDLNGLTKHEIASYLYNWYLPSVHYVFIDEDTALACAEQLHEVFPNAIGISKANEQPKDRLDNKEVTNSKIEILQKITAYLRGSTIGVLIEYLLRVEISWFPLTILILTLIISVFDIINKKA